MKLAGRMSVDDVAKELNLSKNTVRDRIKSGRLIARYDGQQIRVHPDDLKRYWESLPLAHAQ